MLQCIFPLNPRKLGENLRSGFPACHILDHFRHWECARGETRAVLRSNIN